jgi:hypothetical protein
MHIFKLVERVIEALTKQLRFTTTFSRNLVFLSTSVRIVMYVRNASYARPKRPNVKYGGALSKFRHDDYVF